MTMDSAAATARPTNSLQLVCSEVWGGNRPIQNPIELPGLRGHLYSKPCDGGRGGDVHYLSVCGSGLLSRVCVADVAGHGETIAKVSGEIHGLLRRYMNQPDQRRVLGDLNRRLEQSDSPAMTTAAALTYYPPNRSLSISYAGHPPAWVYRAATGRWNQLVIRATSAGLVDMPLAVSPETTYSRHQERVALGDRLLLITDGILEAPAPGGELYGEERLSKVLNANTGDSPVRMVDRIRSELIEFTGDAALRHDDVTMLLIEFVAGPSGPAPWLAIRNRILRPRGNGQTFYKSN